MFQRKVCVVIGNWTRFDKDGGLHSIELIPLDGNCVSHTAVHKVLTPAGMCETCSNDGSSGFRVTCERLGWINRMQVNCHNPTGAPQMHPTHLHKATPAEAQRICV